MDEHLWYNMVLMCICICVFCTRTCVCVCVCVPACPSRGRSQSFKDYKYKLVHLLWIDWAILEFLFVILSTGCWGMAPLLSCQDYSPAVIHLDKMKNILYFMGPIKAAKQSAAFAIYCWWKKVTDQFKKCHIAYVVLIEGSAVCFSKSNFLSLNSHVWALVWDLWCTGQWFHYCAGVKYMLPLCGTHFFNSFVTLILLSALFHVKVL